MAGRLAGQETTAILAELGADIDIPFQELPAAQREWLLTTDEQPTVAVHPVRDAHRVARSYQGTCMSSRRWVLHAFATSKAACLRAKAAS